MAKPITDTEFETLLDEAAAWLDMAKVCAFMKGLSLPMGIAALLPRVFTGYAPAAARTETRGRMYRDGLRTPSRRPTASDRALASARAWGHC